MPTKSGAGTTRRSRAAPRGRPGGSSGCGGRGPRAAQLLCLSPKGLSGLQKSNVFLAATLQHVFESIKKSATIKPPLPPVAGGHWDPRVGGAGASLAWLVAGAQGWADWPDWPLFCPGRPRQKAGLWPLATQLGAWAHRQPGVGVAACRTLAPRKQSPGFQEGQDAKARTLLVGGLGGGSPEATTHLPRFSSSTLSA